MVVSAIHQYESAMGIHMSPPSWNPSHFPPHSSHLGCHTANSHWPSILYMVVYRFQWYSLHSSHTLLPTLCPKLCSLCLLCCLTSRLISIIFLNSVCVCILSHFSHVWLFVTLWTIAHQVPLFMGFSRQEYWNGLLCPPPGDLHDPGIKPRSPVSPALVGWFFITCITWEAQIPYICIRMFLYNICFSLSDLLLRMHNMVKPWALESAEESSDFGEDIYFL